MHCTQSANWSFVIACVIGLVTRNAAFAYGGPGGRYESGNPAYGSGNASINQPLYANSTNSGHFSEFAPAPFSDAASPLLDRGEIVLFSPHDTLREAQYSLNGMPYMMKPGAVQRLKNDRVWTVEVNSGAGQRLRYTLAPGGYKFKPTGLNMSIGLFATQDRPEMSTVALATAPVPSELHGPWTEAPVTIEIPRKLISEHAETRITHHNRVNHFDEQRAPSITASQWINTRNAISLEQLRGKVVLLDFWANWCGPCVANLPKVQALYEKYKDRGLMVVGVHSAQGAESVAAFLAKHSYSFPIAIDNGGTAERYGIEGWPTYILIDKSGTQTWRFGHEPPRDEQIENLLK